jgi:hypothetical protein
MSALLINIEEAIKVVCPYIKTYCSRYRLRLKGDRRQSKGKAYKERGKDETIKVRMFSMCPSLTFSHTIRQFESCHPCLRLGCLFAHFLLWSQPSPPPRPSSSLSTRLDRNILQATQEEAIVLYDVSRCFTHARDVGSFLPFADDSNAKARLPPLFTRKKRFHKKSMAFLNTRTR